MGYTHYYEFKKQPSATEDGKAKFAKAVALFKEKMASLPETVVLANGIGEGEPVITDEKVVFNGRKPNDYETFALKVGDTGYDFCKTAREPYDPAVCLCLLCFKEVFGDEFDFHSDGGRGDDGWDIAYGIMEGDGDSDKGQAHIVIDCDTDRLVDMLRELLQTVESEGTFGILETDYYCAEMD